MSMPIIRWCMMIPAVIALPWNMPAMAEEDIEDVDGLPRVLIIGDSIGQNYTPFVRERLKGKANVHIQSVAASRGGVRVANRALERGPWVLIYFNVGLWDMADRDGSGVTAEPDVYARNLGNMTDVLVGSGAKLIFATTTPVPAGESIRAEGDEKRYNEAAVRVMRDKRVQVHDLHAHASKRPDLQRRANVHYGEEGYRYLAGAAADVIAEALGAGGSSEPMRTWTDARGATVTARLVAADADTVKLQSEDGAETRVPVAALSPADQAYIARWRMK